jgi:hypothetical protein
MATDDNTQTLEKRYRAAMGGTNKNKTVRELKELLLEDQLPISHRLKPMLLSHGESTAGFKEKSTAWQPSRSTVRSARKATRWGNAISGPFMRSWMNSLNTSVANTLALELLRSLRPGPLRMDRSRKDKRAFKRLSSRAYKASRWKTWMMVR